MTRDRGRAGPAEAEPTRPATHSMLPQSKPEQKDPGAVPIYEGQVRMQCRARISRESLDLHRGTHECPSTDGGTHHVDTSAPRLRRDGTTPHGQIASSLQARKSPREGVSATIGW